MEFLTFTISAGSGQLSAAIAVVVDDVVAVDDVAVVDVAVDDVVVVDVVAVGDYWASLVLGAEGEGEGTSWGWQRGIGTQELRESSMRADAAADDIVAYVAVALTAAVVDGEEETMEEVEEEHGLLKIWGLGQEE